MWVVGSVVLLLAVAAVVAASVLEVDEVAEAAVAPTGAVTAADLRRHGLPLRWRGYDVGRTDALLARAATALEDADRYGAPPTDEDRATAVTPSFLASTADLTSEVPVVRTPAEEPEPPASTQRSGEELEDRGGHGSGGLDG